MAARRRTYRLGPADGSVLIRTGREGPAARLGHDLTIEATRWTATAVVDWDAPEASRLTAVVEAGSLEVREARGGVAGLSDGQRAEVETNIREAVLHSRRHPRIRFTSTAVSGDARRAEVAGNLRLHGTTRPLTLVVKAARRGAAIHLTGSMAIVQREFGIAPYSALLGALRVKNVVALTIRVRLPDGR